MKEIDPINVNKEKTSWFFVIGEISLLTNARFIDFLKKHLPQSNFNFFFFTSYILLYTCYIDLLHWKLPSSKFSQVLLVLFSSLPMIGFFFNQNFYSFVNTFFETFSSVFFTKFNLLSQRFSLSSYEVFIW